MCNDENTNTVRQDVETFTRKINKKSDQDNAPDPKKILEERKKKVEEGNKNQGG